MPRSVIRSDLGATRDLLAWSPTARRLFVVAAAVLVGVVVFFGVRAVWQSWLPTGDDAFLTMRARDVLSAHPPLLSTASSGGASAGIEYNHPGPLYLYLIAVPVALTASGAALGSALVNAACVAAVALLIRRARPVIAALTLVGTAGLLWAMGSAVLVDPWNPHAATLPLLVLVIAAWASWNPRDQGTLAPELPIGVLAGSIAAQTHLAFALVTAIAGIALVAGSVLAYRRAPSELRPVMRRTFYLSVGLGLLTCLPMLLDVIAHGTGSNLFRIARGSDFDGQLVSGRAVLGVIADKVVLPPWFGRGSWLGPPFEHQLPGVVLSLVLVVGFIVLVGATVVLALRRGDRQVAVLGCIGLAVIGAGSLEALAFPLRIGIPLPYFRWLWVAAVLCWVAVLARPIELAVRRLTDHGASWIVGVGTVVVVTLATLSLPAYGQAASGSPERMQNVSRSMLEQAGGALDALDGPTLVVPGANAINLTFVPALINELDDRGIDVGVTDPVLVQQSGPHRRATGNEPWVLVAQGLGQTPPEGGRRLATHRELSAAEQTELAELQADVIDQLEAGSVQLTELGRRNAAAADLDRWLELARSDPAVFVRNRFLPLYLDEGFFSFDEVDEAKLRRVAELGAADDDYTTSLWLVPGEVWRSTNPS